MRGNKAITLIALVVTIIVLLILASISLNLVLGEHGIITMAKKAKEDMQLAQKDEGTALNEFYEDMENLGESGASSNSGSTQGGGTETPDQPREETGPLSSKAKPGDYVKYDGGNGYEGLWQVLYNDDTYGLQIISEEVIGMGTCLSTNVNNGACRDEDAIKKYNDAINELNNVCREFVNVDYAESGRCVGSNPLHPDEEFNENNPADCFTLLFEINGSNNSRCKKPDNYPNNNTESLDYLAMKKATSQIENGIAKSNKNYDMAWRNNYMSTDTKAALSIRCYFVSSDKVANDFIIEIYKEKFNDGTYCFATSNNYGSRPVITLKEGIQTNKGDGSKENPFVLLPI